MLMGPKPDATSSLCTVETGALAPSWGQASSPGTTTGAADSKQLHGKASHSRPVGS